MLKIVFLFFLAIIPRLGFIDFVILLSACIILCELFYRKDISINLDFLKVVLSLALIFPIALVAYFYNQDLFGIIRLVKLLLLLILVPLALSTIDEKVFHFYFPLFLLCAVIILYLEYFDIFGARIWVSQIHDFLYHGRDVTYRAKGLFAGYSAAGVTCGFISIYSLFYTFNKKIRSLLGWTLFILSVLATFFTARTGVAVSLLGVFSFIIINYKAILVFKNLVYSVLAVFLVCLIIFCFSDYFDFENMQITFIRTFELFLNYQSKGDISSESTTQLVKTMTLPSEAFEIFFGNGYQPWSELSISSGAHQTDSGIFQTLFLYGLFGFLFYYLPVIFIFLKSFKKNREGISVYSGYLISVIPIAFVSEIKGHYIYSNLIFVLIVFPCFIERRFFLKKL